MMRNKWKMIRNTLLWAVTCCFCAFTLTAEAKEVPPIPKGYANEQAVMTAIVLLGAVFFFVRRLVVPRVRAMSTLSDHLVLLIVAAPFLTGFMAYHQWADSKTIITLHILTGQLMLMAIPLTKVGHMVFFIFARTLFGSEFSLWRGTRKWST